MTNLLRLIDLVRRELGAVDARAEVGGENPEDPRLVWCGLDAGWRLVAVFDAPPLDRNGLAAKLRAIAESFSGIVPNADDYLNASRELASRRLDDELEALADRAGAVQTVVIDAQTPMVWGASGARRRDEDVDTAIKTAQSLDAAEAAGVDLAMLLERDAEEARAALEGHNVDPTVTNYLTREAERIRGASRRSGAAWRHYLLTSRALAAVRERQSKDREGVAHLNELERHDDWAYLARGFASIYCLVLVFEGRFSELHAQAAVVHALPIVERLVMALPPVEPPPRPGKVVSLRPPRSG